MGKKSEITKAKLVKTAKELFLEKGFDGLKMQELADRASINKGLLHYYFKSKEALFKAIFNEAISSIFEGASEIITANRSVEEKLHAIIDLYFDKLLANPGLPVFIISEIHKNPTLEGVAIPLQALKQITDNFFNKGEENIDPLKKLNLFLTVISLSIFPFAARPLLSQIIPKEIGFETFMGQRRIYVKKITTQLIEEL